MWTGSPAPGNEINHYISLTHRCVMCVLPRREPRRPHSKRRPGRQRGRHTQAQAQRRSNSQRQLSCWLDAAADVDAWPCWAKLAVCAVWARGPQVRNQLTADAAAATGLSCCGRAWQCTAFLSCCAVNDRAVQLYCSWQHHQARLVWECGLYGSHCCSVC